MINKLWHALFGHKYGPWEQELATGFATRDCSCGSHQIIDLYVEGAHLGHPMNEY